MSDWPNVVSHIDVTISHYVKLTYVTPNWHIVTPIWLTPAQVNDMNLHATWIRLQLEHVSEVHSDHSHICNAAIALPVLKSWHVRGVAGNAGRLTVRVAVFSARSLEFDPLRGHFGVCFLFAGHFVFSVVCFPKKKTHTKMSTQRIELEAPGWEDGYSNG
jgi:hypothetical protein